MSISTLRASENLAVPIPEETKVPTHRPTTPNYSTWKFGTNNPNASDDYSSRATPTEIHCKRMKSGRPCRLMLVRHGLSQANVNPDLYETTPDQAIRLARGSTCTTDDDGVLQAREAGRFIKQFYEERIKAGEKPKVVAISSCYERARETTREITDVVGDIVSAYREHILIGEQDFGVFEGTGFKKLADRFPIELARLQRAEKQGLWFWARMPQGESRFDVCRRAQEFFGTIFRLAEEGYSDFIIVTHGVTVRAIRMMWCRYTPEWFAQSTNPNNCSVYLIDHCEPSGEKDKGCVYSGFPGAHLTHGAPQSAKITAGAAMQCNAQKQQQQQQQQSSVNSTPLHRGSSVAPSITSCVPSTSCASVGGGGRINRTDSGGDASHRVNAGVSGSSESGSEASSLSGDDSQVALDSTAVSPFIGPSSQGASPSSVEKAQQNGEQSRGAGNSAGSGDTCSGEAGHLANAGVSRSSESGSVAAPRATTNTNNTRYTHIDAADSAHGQANGANGTNGAVEETGATTLDLAGSSPQINQITAKKPSVLAPSASSSYQANNDEAQAIEASSVGATFSSGERGGQCSPTRSPSPSSTPLCSLPIRRQHSVMDRDELVTDLVRSTDLHLSEEEEMRITKERRAAAAVTNNSSSTSNHSFTSPTSSKSSSSASSSSSSSLSSSSSISLSSSSRRAKRDSTKTPSTPCNPAEVSSSSFSTSSSLTSASSSSSSSSVSSSTLSSVPASSSASLSSPIRPTTTSTATIARTFCMDRDGDGHVLIEENESVEAAEAVCSRREGGEELDQDINDDDDDLPPTPPFQSLDDGNDKVSLLRLTTLPAGASRILHDYETHMQRSLGMPQHCSHGHQHLHNGHDNHHHHHHHNPPHPGHHNRPSSAQRQNQQHQHEEKMEDNDEEDMCQEPSCHDVGSCNQLAAPAHVHSSRASTAPRDKQDADMSKAPATATASTQDSRSASGEGEGGVIGAGGGGRPLRSDDTERLVTKAVVSGAVAGALSSIIVWMVLKRFA